MPFDLIKYYDTCCDRCGNWASGDLGTQALSGTKEKVEKVLKKYGWKVINGETICGYCSEGKVRYSRQ